MHNKEEERLRKKEEKIAKKILKISKESWVKGDAWEN